MKKTFLKKLTGVFVAAAAALSIIPSNLAAVNEASAAGTNYHFDFGGGGTASGYTGVSASTGYDKSRGYGFAKTSGVTNVSAAGSGALSDAVQFVDGSGDNNFNVDLPNGLYKIKVTLGNTTRTSIYAENLMQIVNMTGNNATDTILLPITDGQLNIRAAAGKSGKAFTMSALDIEWVSSDTQLPPTIWVCGDSTVCNYYPKDSSAQAGWGQVLDKYVDGSKWQVRNMAASGQYAKGFVQAGQFAPILKYGKAGDIYIISIGINDTNYSNKDEYTQVVTEMTQQAKAKGMTVILVKQQGRAGDMTNNPNLTGRWFSSQLDAIGKAEGVQVIDLFLPFLNYCKSIGQDATNNLYMPGDTLHPNRNGAMKLAEIAASQIDFDGLAKPVEPEVGAEIKENTWFTLKNAHSGHYLTLEAAPGDGTNVIQSNLSADNGYSVWKAKSAGDGYYRIYNKADEKQLLDVANASSEDGANVGTWSDTACDAQLFKFIAQDNGSYIIATKTTNDRSALDVNAASKENGANIQQWSRNDGAWQTWFLEEYKETTKPTDPTDPTEPTKPSEPVIADASIGDVNGDGKVNVLDLALLKKIVNGGERTRTQRRYADFNADTKVDKADCKALNEFLMGKTKITDAAEGRHLFYAADQKISEGVEETTNAGYAYDAYVNLDNKVGSFIEWTVSVPIDGNYLCTFNIANGSANNRAMKIEVNDNKDYWIQPFLTTSAWTTWQERAIVLPLKAGKNIIRTTSDTAEGGPNFDYLRAEWTDEPIAEVYVPQTPVTPPDSGKGVTIYIAGDSTVQTYKASYAPQQGWGAKIGGYFTDNVTISNHAIAGRSSKSFYDNGRLDTILNSIQAGDYLLIQFGINDGASSKPERYAPTCGKVPGTEGSFEFYMAKYIEGAKAKGATPILITPTLSLKSQSGGKFVQNYTNYTDSVKKLADYYKIPYINLNGLMVDHYNKIGYDAAYQYHMCATGSSDMTHFTETGANAVAGLIANAIKGMGLDISGRVK